MWQTVMKKENIIDLIWIILGGFCLLWGHWEMLEWLKSLFQNNMFLNSAFYYSTIPIISALFISSVYYYLYKKFSGSKIAYKLMFFLNFILGVVLIVGIVMLKLPILIMYPIGIAFIAVVVKMYTLVIIQGEI